LRRPLAFADWICTTAIPRAVRKGPQVGCILLDPPLPSSSNTTGAFSARGGKETINASTNGSGLFGAAELTCCGMSFWQALTSKADPSKIRRSKFLLGLCVPRALSSCLPGPSRIHNAAAFIAEERGTGRFRLRMVSQVHATADSHWRRSDPRGLGGCIMGFVGCCRCLWHHPRL
jgi:hypothetical protein